MHLHATSASFANQGLPATWSFSRASKLMRGMSPDLAFQSVDGADAEANQLGRLDDARALGQLQAGALELVGSRARAPEISAHLASLADELAVAGELVFDDAEPSSDPLADHGTLELGESTRDLEQVLAVRRGGVWHGPLIGLDGR